MEIRLALVSLLVLFVLGPVDALSPSPALNHNSSNSSGTSTSSLSPSSPSLSHNSSNSSMISTSTPDSSQSTSKPAASSPRCHQLKVCWLNSPPYVFKDDDTGNISGAFNEAIEFLLSKFKNDCNPKPAYKRCENSSSKLNYSRDQVENARELTECMKMKSGFDLVFPVLSSAMSDNFHKVRFQDIISSPGIAVLKNRKVLAEKARWNVIKEFSQIWTVIVLALLLNAIFGILIWVLESRSNAEEFPRSFLRGSLEGIWWAFVTMATVGYGDKAPKSFLARLLSILWMFTGVAVMAYLTATMTTALTTGIVTDHRKIVNTELGVLTDSPGYMEGMKQGVIVKEYGDLEALLTGLRRKEVEGVLLDVFTASYIFNKKDIDTDIFEQVTILEYPFHIGLYMVDYNRCLKWCIEKEIQRDQTWIYPYVQKHIKGQTIKDKGERRQWTTQLNLFGSDEPAFRLAMYALSSVLAALVVLGLVWELNYRQKSRTFTFKNGNKRDVSGKDFQLARRDFKQLLEHIDDVEKSLAKISELKEFYHKMEGHWIHSNNQRGAKETNRVIL
ncbi:uncharacterized protein [Porites lutea]|uniref:uncharacterized protein n=1 Tax=Porites lutea TaxID=51062 RepID=UPI003CC6CCDB